MMARNNYLLLTMSMAGVLTFSGCASTPPENSSPEPVVEEVKAVEEPAVETMAVSKRPDPIAEPMSSTASTNDAVADLKKGDNEFVITHKEKDATHPMYGQGHKLGFILDGTAGKEIFLRRGETYIFHVRTDPSHDVYLGTNPIGWGGGVLSEGVTGNFSYEGPITFKPTESTPDLVYYQSQNHKSMGWRIHILDKGAPIPKVEKVEPKAKSVKKAASEKEAKQKISFAKMMVLSKKSKMIAEGSHAESKKVMIQAQKALRDAESAIKSGDSSDAFALAEESIALYKKANAMAPNVAVSQDSSKPRYKELLSAVRNFKESHKETYDRTVKDRGEDAAATYDEKAVDKMILEAKELAKQKRYADASKVLEKAEREVTTAINKMLHSQTVVYDKNFETPEEEYQHELGRFDSYHELIPVAIEQKKPGSGAIKLMKNFTDKGLELREKAVAAAKEKNYSDAILMLQAGTEKVRKGLRFVGIR